MKKTLRLMLMCVSGAVGTGPAMAQELRTLVDSPVPFTYSRGRNVAVTDRDRPEVQALGVNLGGFQLYPRLQIGIAYTDNVYQDDSIKTSDGVVQIEPGISVRSNWSRHSLILTGSADVRRYFKETIRDETGLNAAALGRFDVGAQSFVNVEASTARLYESNFSGAALATFATPRQYQRNFAAVRGNYVTGQFRFVGAYDFNRYTFKQVELLSGGFLSQASRNREISRVTGQAEYAISPDTSVFAQVGYVDSNYLDVIPGLGFNRDSTAVRVLGGVSFDLTSFIRGSVGAGYSSTRYKAPLFPDIKGVSVEAQLEYFPSQLTTIGLKLRRIIEDSTAANTSGYFNTGANLSIDHELLRNLLLNGSLDYEIDTYRGANAKAKIFRVSGNGIYSINRNAAIKMGLSYGDRDLTGTFIGAQFREVRGNATLQLQI